MVILAVLCVVLLTGGVLFWWAMMKSLAEQHRRLDATKQEEQ